MAAKPANVQVQAIFQNAKNFLEILKSCRTDHVTKWNTKDLQRAIDWAVHFELVHRKMCSLKESVREKFNVRLVKMGKDSGCFTSKDEDQFDIEFLGRGMHFLVKSLLENPSLKSELKDHLTSNEEVSKRGFKECVVQDGSKNTELLEKLIEIQTSFMAYPELCLLPVTGSICVNSSVLLEELKLKTSKGLYSSCSAIINETVVTQEWSQGMEVVLTCLVLAQYKHYDTVKTRLLNWFSSNLKKYLIFPMTSSYCQLLAAVSRQQTEFFQIYIHQLVQITDDCNTQYTAMPSGGVNQTRLSYDEVMLPWQHLCKCLSIRDNTLCVIKDHAARFKDCSVSWLHQPSTSCNNVWKKLLVNLNR